MPGVLLIVTFILSLAGTSIIKGIAINKNIIDVPNVRSSHLQPTPRGGGLAIAITWFIAIVVLLILKNIKFSLFIALLCGIPITIIGLIDDIVSVSPKLRLLVQVLSTSAAVFFLGGFSSIDLGFGTFHASFFLSIVAVIGIVWLTNLFNFLDGIDGYLGVEVIFICVAAFFLFGVELPLFLAASTAGFLIWNWQPAKIFMGDVGSTLLGFTVGVFSIYYQNVNQSSIFIWLMLTSLFWFDATITLLRRFKNHEKLSEAHKKHAYQRIVQSGFSHKKTVICSLVINLSILGLVWLAIKFPFLLLPLFGINIIYLYVLIRFIDKRISFN
jgi:UDP-N-acetylmuramyl pentapeptide phosphotransferase/UDP-N-acetylglucosamine-1-phosphate transferase